MQFRSKQCTTTNSVMTTRTYSDAVRRSFCFCFPVLRTNFKMVINSSYAKVTYFVDYMSTFT